MVERDGGVEEEDGLSEVLVFGDEGLQLQIRVHPHHCTVGYVLKRHVGVDIDIQPLYLRNGRDDVKSDGVISGCEHESEAAVVLSTGGAERDLCDIHWLLVPYWPSVLWYLPYEKEEEHKENGTPQLHERQLPIPPHQQHVLPHQYPHLSRRKKEDFEYFGLK